MLHQKGVLGTRQGRTPFLDYMMEDLTVPEVAELFRVSTKTVRRWIARGYIRAYKLPGNRLIRIDVDSLDSMKRYI